MFQLKLLGGLSLQAGSSQPPAAALQKKRLAILAIVGLAGNRGISRDRIQAYLWPESDSVRARHALDQLVYATRRALSVDPFIAEGHELRLDPAVMSTDTAAFERAIESGELERGVALYRGRLLDGIAIGESHELENFIDSEAARLEQSYRKALETLALRAASAGDRAGAIGWRRKLAASDPLSSAFALALMTELAGGGDNPAAVQHARGYQDLVRRELGVEPDPRIEQLIASISRPVSSLASVQAPPVSGATEGVPQIPGIPPHPLTARIALGALVAVIAVAAFSIVTAKPVTSGRAGAEPRSREAHAAYLRGLTAWEDRSRSALDTAVVYFRRAAELDPSYAEAQAGLANAYVMIGYSGYRPGEAMYPKAKAAAQRAISLDSTQAAPYAALGMELTWERDFKAAARSFEKALALDPGYATGHQWYGILLRITGDIPGSVAETGKAAELEPLSLQIQNNYATFLAGAGQHDAAFRHYRKVVGEEPDSSWVRRNPWLLTNMASVYAQQGRHEDALRFARRAIEILPGHPRAVSSLAGVYRVMGKNADARATMERADPANPHYAAYRGLFFAAEGQADSAFAWFDRVEDWGVPVLISLRGLNRISGDPRYAALLTRLGMSTPKKAEL